MKTLYLLGALALLALAGYSIFGATVFGESLVKGNRGPLYEDSFGGFSAVSLVALAGGAFLLYKVVK